MSSNRRNRNRFNVALHNECGRFLRYIKADDAVSLLRRGVARVLKFAGELERRIRAIALTPPPPLPSDSAVSPTTITLADMLHNVGQTIHAEEYLTREAQQAAQEKIAAFAVPSWFDRLVPVSA